jgi:hypothetical protein
MLRRTPTRRRRCWVVALDTNGRLSIAADGRPPDVRPGDTVITLALVGPPDTVAEGEGARADADPAGTSP